MSVFKSRFAFWSFCFVAFMLLAAPAVVKAENNADAEQDAIELLSEHIENTKKSLNQNGTINGETETQAEEAQAQAQAPAQTEDTTPKWQPNRSANAIRSNPFLMNLIDQGVRIIPLGHEGGFDGWLTMKDGRIQTFYTQPDNDVVLSGLMIAGDGRNLTAQQIMRYQAISGNQISLQETTPDGGGTVAGETPAQRFWREAGTATWFSYGGQDAPILYLFTTPDCAGCKDYFSILAEQYARENIVQIRVIMVGNSDESNASAAQILSLSNPSESWYGYALGLITHFDNEASLVARANLANNRGLLQSRKLDTKMPLTLYRTPKGVHKIVQGLPENIQDLIVDLTIE